MPWNAVVSVGCLWGRPGDGLVGFLWGATKAFGGSRSWPFRDSGLQLPDADPRLSPCGWPAVDCLGSFLGRDRPEARRRGGA